MIGRYQCEEQKYVALLHVERQVREYSAAGLSRRCVVASFSSAAAHRAPVQACPREVRIVIFLVVFGAQAAQAVLAQVGSVKEIAVAADRVLTLTSLQRRTPFCVRGRCNELTWPVAFCMSNVARRMMPVACCRLRDVCCMLHVA